MLFDLLYWPGSILLILAGAGCVYLAIALVAVWRFSSTPLPTASHHPSVVILKPVCGADPGLYENLVSFARQSYRGPVQMVIGAHRDSDPAVAVARQVIADLPERDIHLVIDETLGGTNYKICNLQNMMAVVKPYDILVIADSDMRAEPHYLESVTTPLQDPGNGLVTCLYRGHSTGGLSSDFGAAHINFGFLPSVLVGRLFGGAAGCFGATMVIRRTTFAAIGGFAALINHLADDYMLGLYVRAQGLKTVLSRYIIDDYVLEPDFKSLFAHELRWHRTIRSITPLGLAGSILTNPVGLALIALPLSGFAASAWLILFASLATRTALIYSCCFALGQRPLSPVWIPARDALTLVILIASFFGHRVTWRNSAFHVGDTGELTLEQDV